MPLDRLAARLATVAGRKPSGRMPPREGPRIFGVGAAKTGTHSLGEMFAHRVPSAHEADCEALIELVLRRERDGSEPVTRALRRRDRERGLKIDASQVNIYLLDELAALFPDSRYVLTVRDPRDWLRSMIDDSLRRTPSETWMRFRDHRFGAKADAPREAPLARRGLHSLAGYLGYWRHSIEVVLARVPHERLLIVATPDLLSRAPEIAEFCGMSGVEAAPAKAHAFSNPERFGVLEEIEAGHLDDAIAAARDGLSDALQTFGPGMR